MPTGWQRNSVGGRRGSVEGDVSPPERQRRTSPLPVFEQVKVLGGGREHLFRLLGAPGRVWGTEGGSALNVGFGRDRSLLAQFAPEQGHGGVRNRTVAFQVVAVHVQRVVEKTLPSPRCAAGCFPCRCSGCTRGGGGCGCGGGGGRRCRRCCRCQHGRHLDASLFQLSQLLRGPGEVDDIFRLGSFPQGLHPPPGIGALGPGGVHHRVYHRLGHPGQEVQVRESCPARVKLHGVAGAVVALGHDAAGWACTEPCEGREGKTLIKVLVIRMLPSSACLTGVGEEDRLEGGEVVPVTGEPEPDVVRPEEVGVVDQDVLARSVGAELGQAEWAELVLPLCSSASGASSPAVLWPLSRRPNLVALPVWGEKREERGCGNCNNLGNRILNISSLSHLLLSLPEPCPSDA